MPERSIPYPGWFLLAVAAAALLFLLLGWHVYASNRFFTQIGSEFEQQTKAITAVRALRWELTQAAHHVVLFGATEERRKVYDDAARRLERPTLRPLPLHHPPACLIAHRVVDTEGYVRLETNRYSVPERLLGKAVEAHQYFDTVVVLFQGQEVPRHPRAIGQRDRRLTAPGHHAPPRSPARGAVILAFFTENLRKVHR